MLIPWRVVCSMSSIDVYHCLSTSHSLHHPTSSQNRYINRVGHRSFVSADSRQKSRNCAAHTISALNKFTMRLLSRTAGIWTASSKRLVIGFQSARHRVGSKIPWIASFCGITFNTANSKPRSAIRRRPCCKKQRTSRAAIPLVACAPNIEPQLLQRHRRAEGSLRLPAQNSSLPLSNLGHVHSRMCFHHVLESRSEYCAYIYVPDFFRTFRMVVVTVLYKYGMSKPRYQKSHLRE